MDRCMVQTGKQGRLVTRAPVVLSSRWLDVASFRSAFPDSIGRFPMLRYQPYEARWLTIRFDFGLYDKICAAKSLQRSVGT